MQPFGNLETVKLLEGLLGNIEIVDIQFHPVLATCFMTILFTQYITLYTPNLSDFQTISIEVYVELFQIIKYHLFINIKQNV